MYGDQLAGELLGFSNHRSIDDGVNCCDKVR